MEPSITKRKRSIRKDGTPADLLRRVRSGEHKTIEQWARVYKKTVNHMQGGVLNSLRKHNHMIYPVGTTGHNAGVLMDITTSKKNFREVSERVHNNFTNSHIIGTFRMLENFLIAHPEANDEIELKANELLSSVLNQKKLLLQAKIHGTN